MTAIIILNWNGYRDTCACLSSLFACRRQDFVWMVVDNGSSDNSVTEISRFLNHENRPFVEVKEGAVPTDNVSPGCGILYSLKENYGFAKGNNLGIALMERITDEVNKPSHYLLLNNDTLVEPYFLAKLEDFAKQHPQYVALTPQIRYAEPRDVVWNCGGNVVFGFRIHYYEDKPCSQIRKKDWIDIRLITGCALFVKRELLGKSEERLRKKSEHFAQRPLSPTYNTNLLSERFFFGEEDFDFSLRMREENKKMACVLDSLVYHNCSASQKNVAVSSKMYVYYLNRFVDVRQHWNNKFKYLAFKVVYTPYMMRLFHVLAGESWTSSWKKTLSIMKEASKLDEVSKEKYTTIIAPKKRKS